MDRAGSHATYQRVVLRLFVLAIRPRRRSPTQAPRIQVVPHAVAPRVDVTSTASRSRRTSSERGAKSRPLSAAHRQGHGRHARMAARAAAERARRPSPSHRPVVQLRRRERPRLLEQLRRDPGRPRPRMGTIVHKRVIEASSGRDKGELERRDGLGRLEGHAAAQGEHPLRLPRRRHQPDDRSHHRLTAMKEPVVLRDNKEGVLGIRVARGLEQPSTRPTCSPTPTASHEDQGGEQRRA